MKFDVKTALPTQTKQQKGTNNLATILKLPSPGLPMLHPLKLAYLAMWMLVIFLCQYVLREQFSWEPSDAFVPCGKWHHAGINIQYLHR